MGDFGKKTVLAWVLSMCAVMVWPTTASAKSPPKATVVYSTSSVNEYLEYAMDKHHCSGVEDAFDKRRCKRQWNTFSRKMLSWVKKVRLIDDGLTVDIGQYDFRRGRFVITHDAGVTVTSGSDLRYRVVIGKGKCDKLTGMVDVGQKFTIRMSPKRAEKNILRQSAGENTVTAILSGKSGRINWCCDAYTRRDARLNGEQCNAPVFVYTIQGFRLDDGEGESFKHSFPAAITVQDFDPAVLGVPIPTGSGDFEDPAEPEDKL
jgi:hypothetical protein